MTTKPRAKGSTRLTIRNQVQMPSAIIKALGLETGTPFEVTTDGEKITFIPARLVTADDDPVREAIAEGLRDMNAGRTHGPFKNGKEFAKYMEEIKK